MQAEGIRKGDRYDVHENGRVVGGWTATGDAVVRDGYAYAPVRFHDGEEGTNSWPVGQQVPLSWGAGPVEQPAPVERRKSDPSVYPPAHCRACGADLEHEQGAGWVDARSGDDGGTYDYCPETDSHAHEPRR